MRPYSKRTVVGWPFGSTRVSSRAVREETSRDVVELTVGACGPGAVRNVRSAPRDTPAGLVATSR